MRPNLRQGFLKGGFHPFGGRVRGNLRGHVVQMLPKVLGVSPILTFNRPRDNLGKIALGRNTGGARLSCQCGVILLRQSPM
jgi:hypothetical protein